MKIVIIEDEQHAADSLMDMIQAIEPTVKLVSTLRSVKESVEWLKIRSLPDLIFTDIRLSDGNSFDIFKEVEVAVPVVFTTAFNQYAIDAFKVNSIDYLLKPIKVEDLASAIKKYKEVHNHHVSMSLKNLNDFLRTWKASQQKRSRFLVKQGKIIKSVQSEEVACIVACEGLAHLFTQDGKKFISDDSLDHLESQLDPKSFFRISRQCIVNINAIHEVKPYSKGRLSLRLKEPLSIEQVTSTHRSAPFKQWLDS